MTRGRRLLVALAIGLAAGLGGLVVWSLRPLDRRAVAWLAEHRESWPRLTSFAHLVTQIGNAEVALPAGIAIALACFLLRMLDRAHEHRKEAIFWLAVAGGGQLLNMGLKLWFQRERPPEAQRLVTESSYSFPSGHGMLAGALFLLIVTVALRESAPWSSRSRVAIVATGLLLMLSVAASRVWLGVHFVTDVTAGFLLGAFWAGAAVAMRHRRGRRRVGA